MKKYRVDAKVDSNQLEIVASLRKYGAIVTPGHDDILVAFDDKLFWIELKESSPFTKKGTLKSGIIKPSQYKLLETMNDTYAICWTITQCFDFLNGFDGDYITPSKYIDNIEQWRPKLTTMQRAEIIFNSWKHQLDQVL